MSESKDKIWQLRKSFLESESQDETAAGLLKMKDPEQVQNGLGDTLGFETELTKTPKMPETEINQNQQTNIQKPSDTTPEPSDIEKSGSTSNLAQDSTVDISRLDATEKTSQRQPLLNGVHKNGSAKEQLNSAVSQNSVWSQGDRKEGSVISFHNIDYTVKVPAAEARCGCGKKEEKYILKDIRYLLSYTRICVVTDDFHVQR